MKILHIITDKNIGGAGIHLLNLIDEIDKEKYEIEVLLPEDGKLIGELEKRKCKVYQANISEKSFAFEDVMTIYKIIKESKPSIVHTHACLSGRVAAKLSFTPIVFTKHCISKDKVFFLKKLLNNFLCTKAIAVSRAAADNLEADGIKYDKINLIYNGVKIHDKIHVEEIARFKKIYSIPENKIVFGCIARIEPGKGHDFLIESFATTLLSNSDIHLIIAGEGSLKEGIEKIVALLEIEKHVTFTGFVPVIGVIHNMVDVLLVPSETEAFGLSLAEAMSLKKPSVSTKVDGLVELVKQGVTGFSIEYGNIGQFSRSMEILSRDPELRKKMGINAFEYLKGKFTSDRMARRTEKLYQNIIVDMGRGTNEDEEI